MKDKNKEILKNKFGYHLSKIAPFGTDIRIKLKNDLEFIVRARTMDRSIIKEVWIKEVYDQFGIKVEEGDTVIDIGAHIGIFSVYAAELNKTGKIYSFEPFIDNFKRLEIHKLNNNKENISIYNKGVSNTTGQQTLYLSPDNNTGGHSLHLKKHSTKTVHIETITLANFCVEEKIETIDFLKLDCEGAEFNILKSDETILTKVQKIAMECHPYEQNTIADMVDLLERHNFTVHRISNNLDNKIQMIYGVK